MITESGTLTIAEDYVEVGGFQFDDSEDFDPDVIMIEWAIRRLQEELRLRWESIGESEE